MLEAIAASALMLALGLIYLGAKINADNQRDEHRNRDEVIRFILPK